MSTLAVYRQTLAPLLGLHERGTATASVANTTALLECTTASHTGLRFKSTVNSSGLLEDKWMYIPSALSGDKDRVVSRYTPASGFLVPDDAWSEAQTSRAFEVNGLFSGTETNALLNEGLKRCMVVVEFTHAPVSITRTRHELSTTEPWLIDPRWVLQIGHLTDAESRSRVDPFRRNRSARVAKDGTIVYLEGPAYNTTDVVYVKALKPAYDHCRPTASVFGQQAGLSLESDEAPVDPEWLAWATIAGPARDRLDAAIEQGSPTEVQKALQARAQAAARFSDLTRKNLDVPPRTVGTVAWLGPTFARSWRW